MYELNDTFDAFRDGSQWEHGRLTLGPGFEDKVFTKIRRKKQVRRNISAAVAGFTLAGLLFLAYSLFIANGPVMDQLSQQQIVARQESIPMGIEVGAKHEAEEIPLMEDVIFASSDAQTAYVVEQVADIPDDGTI